MLASSFLGCSGSGGTVDATGGLAATAGSGKVLVAAAGTVGVEVVVAVATKVEGFNMDFNALRLDSTLRGADDAEEEEDDDGAVSTL